MATSLPSAQSHYPPSFGVIGTVVSVATVESLLSLSAPESFRINSSHMEVDRVVEFVGNYCGLRWPGGVVPPLYIDLQGSKIRVRRDQPIIETVTGETVCISTALIPDNKTVLVDAPVLSLINVDTHIFIDDGKLELKVTQHSAHKITAIVLKGGILRSAKGFNLKPHPLRLNALTARDEAIVAATKSFPCVRYALSFAAVPEEITQLKEASGGKFVAVKLEREMTDDQMLALCSPPCDEVWVCRGDMGVQLGLRGLGLWYVNFCKQMKNLKVPVIMAGEVMDHMCEHDAPTRSEVCHLADLVDRGFAGIVLSNETAYGKYPAEVVRFVHLITKGE
ncbi:Pyruvate kinase [Pelomyxa schiedti]|nr:Pyruvate kinase [Pelomyxa schiedti]